ncbi:MAG: transcriptional regulator CadC [Xanthobacteraceae bacterium]|nr:transcriptional regulator CadC [Xanthobacteraceae bacterium]
MFRFAGFELDPQRAELRGPDGEAIKLRPKSYDMLLVFVANAGRVISKTELLEAVWPNVHVGEDSLFQCVREIRVALGDEQRELIKLVSGKGYLFDADVVAGPKQTASAAPVASTTAGSAVAALPAAAPSIAREIAAAATPKRRFPFGLRGPATLALGLGVCAIIGLAVAAPMLRNGIAPERRTTAEPKPLTVIVMPMTAATDDPQLAALTANVTDRLTDGLAKIDNIRVIAGRPPIPPGAALAAISVSVEAATVRTNADFVVDAKLQRGERGFDIEARLTSPAGEVRWAGNASIVIDNIDLDLQQSRLAAGVGHQLARRINALAHSGAPPNSDGKPSTSAKVAVEQATALMNQTNRERFKTAQAMLEKARAEEPDNVEIDVALAAVMMRGIQMVWYTPEEKDAAEREGQAVIERAVRTRPNYIPVLESYCRFLNATNQFVESLVVCAKVMAFDPWDGIGLYHMGLAHMQLGRFEDALASFKQANQYDTPQVSRWTWPLGIGMMHTLMGHDAEAIPWLQRSIAITSATGRTHMILASAYWSIGRQEEAKTVLAKALELRPGSTAENIALPRKNASQAYLKAAGRIRKNLIEAGLPEK